MKKNKHTEKRNENEKQENQLIPRHAYFSAVEDLEVPPEVNAENDFRIAGDHSVRIKASGKDVFLMFDREFPNGEYEYSVLVTGKKGTRLRLVYEVYGDRGREVRPIATFNIPDKRLFQITAHFSVRDLAPGEHFQAGVLVQKGEAYFDNFSLNESEPEVSAAPGAN